MKLIALDLDGTLFNNKSQISKENIKAIKEATAAGINVVISTGRPFGGLPFEAIKDTGIRYAIREQMYRYRVEYLKDPKNYPMLVKEHDAIYRALEARNMELVTTEMHTHVANQAVAVKAVIQKQDEEKK